MHRILHDQMTVSGWLKVMQFSPTSISLLPVEHTPFQEASMLPSTLTHQRRMMWERIYLALWWDLGRRYILQLAKTIKTPVLFRRRFQALYTRILLITSHIEHLLISTVVSQEEYWNPASLSSRIRQAARELAGHWGLGGR